MLRQQAYLLYDFLYPSVLLYPSLDLLGHSDRHIDALGSAIDLACHRISRVLLPRPVAEALWPGALPTLLDEGPGHEHPRLAEGADFRGNLPLHCADRLGHSHGFNSLMKKICGCINNALIICYIFKNANVNVK